MVMVLMSAVCWTPGFKSQRGEHQGELFFGRTLFVESESLSENRRAGVPPERDVDSI
jgi:hypothetical protein